MRPQTRRSERLWAPAGASASWLSAGDVPSFCMCITVSSVVLIINLLFLCLSWICHCVPPAPPNESGALCPLRSAAGAEPAPPLWRGDGQTPWGWEDCPAGQGSETKLSLWQTGCPAAIAGRSQHPGEDLVPQPCPCPWWRKAGQAGPLTSCLCRWTQDSVLVGCLEGSPLRSGRSVWAAPELDFFHGSCQVPAGGVTPGRPRPPPGTQLGHSGPRCLGAGEGRGSRLGEKSFISSLRQVGSCLFHNTGVRTRNSKITEQENKQFPAPRPWRHPPCAWLMGSWLGL